MTEREHVAIRELIGSVLGRTIAPDEVVSRETESGWDSLKHLEMVVLIEDALGVRFDESELASLDSLDSFVQSVARHRAS